MASSTMIFEFLGLICECSSRPDFRSAKCAKRGPNFDDDLANGKKRHLCDAASTIVFPSDCR